MKRLTLQEQNKLFLQSMLQKKAIFGVPPGLTNEIIEKIPKEKFYSNTDTFCDMSAASPEFVISICNRLNSYNQETDFTTRVFAITQYTSVANMIKQEVEEKGYKITIKVIKNILEEDLNMNFDVVVGNPPYQNTHAKDQSSKRKVGNKLWYQFIFKADSIVKNNGYVAFVTPSQWLSGGVNMRHGKLGVLKDIFAKKQLIVANFSNITEKYFKGIGANIGWWVYKNSPVTDKTLLIFNDSSLNLHLKDLEFLSPNANAISMKIVLKTLLADNKKFESYYFNAQCAIGAHGETEQANATNTIPHWIMGSSTTKNLAVKYFPKPLNKKVFYKKVLFPMSTRYWQPHLADEHINVATLGQALKVSTSTTQSGFESVFYSKLYKYLCYNLQIAQNGFMKTSLVKSLPNLDLSRIWTDNEIYKHFDLTQEEIDYIESSVK